MTVTKKFLLLFRTRQNALRIYVHNQYISRWILRFIKLKRLWTQFYTSANITMFLLVSVKLDFEYNIDTIFVRKSNTWHNRCFNNTIFLYLKTNLADSWVILNISQTDMNSFFWVLLFIRRKLLFWNEWN